jgi:hypothetical protein
LAQVSPCSTCIDEWSSISTHAAERSDNNLSWRFDILDICGEKGKRPRGPRRRLAGPSSSTDVLERGHQRSLRRPAARGSRGRRLCRRAAEPVPDPLFSRWAAAHPSKIPVQLRLSDHVDIYALNALVQLRLSESLGIKAQPYIDRDTHFATAKSARRWRHAWRRWKGCRASGQPTVQQGIIGVHGCFLQAGGPIGRCLRRGYQHGTRCGR